MKQFTSKTQKTGELGENICTAYLKKAGFKMIERNYTKNFGEIDIIAKKNTRFHFIEVKSIKADIVTRETYNPVENFTKEKHRKFYKTVMAYLAENHVSRETKWQIDLYCIYIDTITNNHKLSKIKNIVM